MSAATEAVSLFMTTLKNPSRVLTDDEKELLNNHRGLTDCIDLKSKILPIGCPVCGRVGFMTTGTIPKCRLTIGCTGKPAKITAETDVSAVVVEEPEEFNPLDFE